MKTRFDIKIAIDEKIYELEYKDLSKTKSDEILASFNAGSQLAAQLQSANLKLAVLNEQKQAYSELAAISQGEKKQEYMDSVTQVLGSISKLIDEIQALSLEASKTDEKVELASKARFEQCLSGKDYTQFALDVAAAGLSFARVMNEIDEEVIKEREKKL